MKIATWNVNSLNVRLPRLVDWLAAQAPDVVCLQETKTRGPEVSAATALARAGYTAHFAGQKTYNGVAILVRDGLAGDRRRRRLPGFADEQKRVIAATVAGIRVVNVYVPNGQAVDSDKYRVQARVVRGARRDSCARSSRAIRALAVLGDFNVAPEDRDVHDPALWAGQVLCSAPERAAFRDVLALGLVDSFRLFRRSPRRRSAGGTTGSSRSRRTTACASTTCCCPPPLAARCTGEPHRPQRAQGREAVGSRAGAGGVEPGLSGREAGWIRRQRSPGRAATARERMDRGVAEPTATARLRRAPEPPWSSRRRSSCSCSSRPTLAAYFAAPKGWRNGVLLVASLAFYAWGEAPYLVLVIGSVALQLRDRRRDRPRRRTRGPASAGWRAGRRGQPRRARRLQVRELRRRQRQRAGAGPRDHAARRRVDPAADRHLVLHVPRDLVRRRRLHAQRQRRAQPAATSRSTSCSSRS